LAISKSTGVVVEKRLFDAWGSLIKYWNASGVTTVPTGAGGLLLDRGYTGHEHLLSFGIIHMNGRLYDPKLHRFLQPDNFVQEPFNTQNYNRYGYCWNNPLKYTDPSGEWFWMAFAVGAIVGAVSGGAAYAAQAIKTGNWNWGQFGLSVLGGALIGGISGGYASMACTVTTNAVMNALATGLIAGMMPTYGVQVGDWSFSISPSIAFGNAMGIGASLSVTYSSGDFSFSAGVGIMSNSNYNGFGKNGMEIRRSILASYDDGRNGVSYGTNIWSGGFDQTTGVVGVHFGDFRAMYENDGSIGPGGDGGDKFRTAALNLSVGKFNFGFNLFTGNRDYEEEANLQGGHRGSPEIDKFDRRMPNGYALERDTKYRLGALTVGYGGFRVGVNSEHVRHAIQDQAIHNLYIPGIIDKRQRGFENQSWDWKGYTQYKSSNMFTSW
jgi:RHS repeat-associated protein